MKWRVKSVQLIHFEQQVGDLEVWHDAVDDFLEPLRLLRHALRERLDFEHFIGEVGLGQGAVGGQPVDVPQLGGEQREPVAQVALAIGSDHRGEFTGIPQGREAGGREQIVLEVLELP